MRVLYVCTGNSFRSPVAEALTRKLHPELEVESAGTEPTDGVAEVGKELLEEEGARQYVKPSPDRLSQRAIDDADLVVAMMPEHREFLEQNLDLSSTELEVWNVEDSVDPGVEPGEAFESLERKVRGLQV